MDFTSAFRYIRSTVLIASLVLSLHCGGGAGFRDDGLRLAHDAKTGEYIGEKVGERKVKDPVTGRELILYKIKRRGGEEAELPAETVKLSKP